MVSRTVTGMLWLRADFVVQASAMHDGFLLRR
jgi:hypothetical protein